MIFLMRGSADKTRAIEAAAKEIARIIEAGLQKLPPSVRTRKRREIHVILGVERKRPRIAERLPARGATFLDPI